ncbi:putative tellurium resistance membrane protein TerC [Geothermobacter ehrlichii]|uniref:Putative tellurium resistance membrane protein TerC n=1 Tax=Geothermobacter ehrlichii TaxID=213224 RepID=A0A5D3WMD5_9BACT|nr:TerC family protein [Geothermobacter ehrlichii]TYO98706.1 putative tellurium resistance membrane protein TerC [Geothermobacter ehrlichii]
MYWIADPEAWVALATLVALEIVLGIDNIIFITILVGRLPERQRRQGRLLGLGLAMVTRLLLLLSLSWIMGLTSPLFELFGRALSGRDLILLGGGLFLLVKSTFEIHASLEGEEETSVGGRGQSFVGVLVQIALLDIVFSLDSVITAVGLARDLPVMMLAIILAVLAMMLAAGAIGRFVEEHPTFKMLALSFLILIGVTLMADGLGLHVPKGYVYFAMGFSVAVELLNMKVRKRRSPVHLHRRVPVEKSEPARGEKA